MFSDYFVVSEVVGLFYVVVIGKIVGGVELDCVVFCFDYVLCIEVVEIGKCLLMLWFDYWVVVNGLIG